MMLPPSFFSGNDYAVCAAVAGNVWRVTGEINNGPSGYG